VAGSPRVPPRNPLMIESELARAGVERGNEVNGREYVTDDANEPGMAMDLQYACIFPLPEPRDCSTARPGDGCDCAPTDLDRPLCERDPGVSAAGTTQYWAKAYPGTRQLQVLEAYGKNSIVASICARNVDITTQNSRADFGYRPAVDSIVERLKERLGDRCLPRGLLATDPEEPVACTLVESVTRPSGACVCDAAIARRAPDEQTSELIRAELATDIDKPCGVDDPSCSRACLCEVLQVQQVPGQDPVAALRACQEDESASGVEGWCYIADTDSQQIGNPELVAACPPTERQVLRFVGQGLRRNTTTFVSCQGSSLAAQRGVTGSD
jgi:hypothetical protein